MPDLRRLVPDDIFARMGCWFSRFASRTPTVRAEGGGAGAPKGKNGISYHGVFGSWHRFRNEVIAEPPKTEPRERLTKTPGLSPSRWHGWADLLWRVFEDLAGPGGGLACECGGRLTLHAVVRPPAALDVLESLERCGPNGTILNREVL